MRAAHYGHDWMVTQLLDNGACIDSADKVGALSVRIKAWRKRLRERKGRGREGRGDKEGGQRRY